MPRQLGVTEDTEEPVCPHCGDIPKEWGESELRNGDPMFWNCMACGHLYRVTARIRIRFTTTKLDGDSVNVSTAYLSHERGE